MGRSNLYSFAADAILLLHVLFVAFVVVGLILIFVGVACKWSWVRNRKFRFAHLAGIGVVVVQSWLGVICPLTNLEMALRERAGDAVYSESFIAHLLERILYHQAPPWVFVVCYTAFGALVVSSWIVFRPSGRKEG
ncbi:MAG: DUF2784 domain-containing protein [Verrucomicrobia bacterium]|nr:DUF2784 domain-containing protein [Verrucomicrobiota bacterium]